MVLYFPLFQLDAYESAQKETPLTRRSNRHITCTPDFHLRDNSRAAILIGHCSRPRRARGRDSHRSEVSVSPTAWYASGTAVTAAAYAEMTGLPTVAVYVVDWGSGRGLHYLLVGECIATLPLRC